MALKIREEALRKRRIQADFARWAKRLKPSIPVAGGPRPTGVVQRAVPTEVLEREAPAVTRDVSPAEAAAQARPEIILPGPLLQEGPEEPEEAPVGAVPLFGRLQLDGIASARSRVALERGGEQRQYSHLRVSKLLPD